MYIAYIYIYIYTVIHMYWIIIKIAWRCCSLDGGKLWTELPKLRMFVLFSRQQVAICWRHFVPLTYLIEDITKLRVIFF